MCASNSHNCNSCHAHVHWNKVTWTQPIWLVVWRKKGLYSHSHPFLAPKTEIYHKNSVYTDAQYTQNKHSVPNEISNTYCVNICSIVGTISLRWHKGKIIRSWSNKSNSNKKEKNLMKTHPHWRDVIFSRWETDSSLSSLFWARRQQKHQQTAITFAQWFWCLCLTMHFNQFNDSSDCIHLQTLNER